MDQLFCSSSEEMLEVADSSVALTVTSPPYYNAIDYDTHASGDEGNYRSRPESSYDDYLEWLLGVFLEVLRTTKDGGFCAVIVGTVLDKGKHYPLPFDMVPYFIEGGWEFRDAIVWHKCTAGVKRAGSFIQHPHPGYFYPNIMHEMIVIFRKPGPPIYVDRTTRPTLPIDTLFKMDVANSIWHIAPVPPGHLEHPCPFPEEIPHRLISLYSYPGDLVLDPFLGSGQTTKVAKHLGRRYVGYDLEQTYVDYATKRLDEPLSIRPKQLIARFEKIDVDT